MAIVVGTEPEVMPLDWEKGTPNKPGHNRINPMVRLGLLLDRFSAAHHKHEIEVLKREIAAKRALLQKGKRRKGRKR